MYSNLQTVDTIDELNGFFDNYIEKFKSQEDLGETVWKEDPLHFREFIISPEHMNFEPFSERQLAPIDFLFGDDPKKIFTNGNYMTVLEFGKGCISGDTKMQDALTDKEYTIAELYEKKKKIFVKCVDIELQPRIQLASVPWIKGIADLYRIKTESGKEVSVAMEHKFLSKGGWKSLIELKIGDEILDDVVEQIVCQECGRSFKSFLSNSHLKGHRLTPQEYKVKYDLFLLCTKNYSDFLSKRIFSKERNDKISKHFKDRKKNYDVWNKGLTKETDERMKLVAKKIAASDPSGRQKRYLSTLTKEQKREKYGSQGVNHPLYGKHQSEDSKRRSRENQPTYKKTIDEVYSKEKCKELRKKYSNPGKKNGMYGKHPPKGSGRCKWETISISSGDMLVQGSLEKEFALLMDSLDVKIQRNKRRFEYIDKTGKKRTYSPDFLLQFESDLIYIETKGWITEEMELKLNVVRDAGERIELLSSWDLYYLKKRFRENLKWDKIKSITFDRRDKFYDLEVPKYYNYLAQGLYHHNSGKDTIAWAAMNYMVYILLCHKNPQRLVGIPVGETLDILNVAYSSQQATNVFFVKMKYRVMNWKWLSERYHIKISGSPINRKEKEGIYLDYVTINSDGIQYPNGVRIFSGNSSEESFEGLNLLCFVADEISAFRDATQTRNATKMLDMLRTSATSRFGNKYKSLILSFPRFKDDPIERLVKIYEKELHVYTDKASTWEVKPERCFSDKFFQYEGMTIPIDFQDEFRLHPESSLTKFAVRPAGAESPLITRPHLIDVCINRTRRPIFEFEDRIEEDKFGQKYLKKSIIKRNIQSLQQIFVIDIDLGLSGDSAAMSIGHLDEEFDKVILDAHTAWDPVPSKGIVVSITNVEEIAKDICKVINVGGVYYDRWNCLAGDTKISLLDGREVPIKELAESDKKFWVYSFDGKEIVPDAGRAYKSGTNAPLYRLTLDDDSYTDTTSEHLFMMRDGSFKKLSDIKNGESLMPLYRKEATSVLVGYELYYEPFLDKWKYTHRMVMRKLYPDKYKEYYRNGYHIHHKSFNARNNSPDELEFETKANHMKIHTGTETSKRKSVEGNKRFREKLKKEGKHKEFYDKVTATCKERYGEDYNKKNIKYAQKGFREKYDKGLIIWPEWKQESKDSQRETVTELWKDPCYRKNHSDAVSISSKRVWQDPVYREKQRIAHLKYPEIVRRCPRTKCACGCGEVFVASSWIENGILECQKYIYGHNLKKVGINSRFGKGYIPWNKNISKSYTFNHRVRKIEFLGHQDVYDIETDRYHNFALSAGVFVHNSASSIQSLNEEGIHSAVVSVKFKDWLDLRERFYSERIDVFPDMQLIGQVKQMQNIKNMRIDHPVDGHDDRAYSLAGLVKVLTAVATKTSRLSDEGEMITGNLAVEGFVIPRGSSKLM